MGVFEIRDQGTEPKLQGSADGVLWRGLKGAGIMVQDMLFGGLGCGFRVKCSGIMVYGVEWRVREGT